MSKKIALVTGCSDGGLGSALAIAFHKKGYRVIATARNVSKLGDVKSNNIETVTLDVLSAESIKAAVAEVTKLTDGKLDVLVNNAGGGYSMPVVDIDLKQIRDVFELNVFSVIAVTQGFLPLLQKSKGMVVNNTSIAGTSHGGMPMMSSYNATKAAMGTITNSLRLELEPFGIKVVDLKTGAVKTNFFNNTTDVHLPKDSIYQPAKSEIEAFMAGGTIFTNASKAEDWASGVVNDLSKSSPPALIWRGQSASLVWLASFLPVWLMDSMVKNMSGIKALEKNLRKA